MANKRVQVSVDAGATWLTLPGNAGEARNEMANVGDTIFGQPYESNQPSLGQFNFTANGIFKGVAGYNAVIKKPGTPVAMTAEAAALVSGKTYRISAATKRVISYANALTVFDNAVDRTSEVLTVDYLAGTVTFKGSYTVVGPVTLTGSYVPMAVIAKARSFTLTQTQSENDETGYEDAQGNGGMRVFAGGLKSVSLDIGGIYRAANAWLTSLQSRGIVYIECDVDAVNPGLNVFRGFFKINNRTQSGNQGDVETETVTMGLWVPDGALVEVPFSWYVAAGSTLNAAVKACLNAWINQTSVLLRYLPSGATGATPLDGIQGSVIVTEASLANAIDGQNEFSFSFRGSGTATAV